MKTVEDFINQILGEKICHMSMFGKTWAFKTFCISGTQLKSKIYCNILSFVSQTKYIIQNAKYVPMYSQNFEVLIFRQKKLAVKPFIH